MQKDYSLGGLLKFLDYAAEKGLLKAETAKGRKTASNAILGVLETEDLADLRRVDIEVAASRFANLYSSKFSPASMQVYKSRVTSAVGDFVNWVDNPMTFKTSVATKNSNKPPSKKAQNSEEKEKGPPPAVTPQPKPPNFEPETGIVFPIPLRTNLVVRIANLPSDLTEAEASKIAAVVKALAAR